MRGAVIDEIYELNEQDGGTQLTQTLNIENPGVNIILRAIIWLIQRFGNSVGKTYLETLKELVDSGNKEVN